ncbi:hypothetical protein Rmet_6640 (plasmid) [Cupriavidus metallidurans CH34]|uniref:Uncharacterized protein n=1 Tax=Cupriavidus metallidurans (strain ATCC 43123 / DSM 2839 / NBRC 102507 / CH34) TaxID=266264 RepID=D3DY70_CUPMC|nr:hypothetical protein Rmet_6640 [Cupriavidus metallidurans CH34]
MSMSDWTSSVLVAECGAWDMIVSVSDLSATALAFLTGVWRGRFAFIVLRANHCSQ